MGGKAIRTNVAGGMSGSPVYIDGKLIGAVALRMSVFSPDAICGITPIELMLEINDFDKSRPEDAKTPDKIGTRNGQVAIDSPMLQQLVSAGAGSNFAGQMPIMVPIETPLTFSGFHENVCAISAPCSSNWESPWRRADPHGKHPTNHEARCRLGALAEPRRDRSGRAGGWRYERHRRGYGHLQRWQARAGFRPSVLQSRPDGYADDARAKC